LVGLEVRRVDKRLDRLKWVVAAKHLLDLLPRGGSIVNTRFPLGH
jgi:hypothetical protein